MKSNNPVQSVQRAFDVIEALSGHPHGIALTELSRAVGLSKSTVHRFLCALSEMGYAVKEPSTGKYRLTLRMFEIGSRVVHALDILGIARPHLERISDLTNEVVHLVKSEGNKVVYLFKLDRAFSSVKMASVVGNSSPMYCTGVGKAIMAFLPVAEAKKIWDESDISRYTHTTILTFEDMEREMTRIRQNGFAHDNEEHEPGVSCLAAPIFDYSGKPTYAISISIPTARMNEECLYEYAALVRHAAHEISLQFGLLPTGYTKNTQKEAATDLKMAAGLGKR